MFRFFLILLTIFSHTVLAAQTTIRLSGLSGELEDNVQLYLNRYGANDISTSLRFQSRLEQDISTALQALGYYDSEITIQLQQRTNGSRLNITVDAGEPIRINTVDLQVLGDAATDPEFINLLKQAPQPGQIVHHGRYDNFKNSLNSLALRRGYFDATFTLARLEVSPRAKQAFVKLHFDSGTRYRFGEVRFSGEHIQSARLQSLVPFKAGDPYLATQLGELNQALANTNWFSSILVTGNTEQLSETILPVDVELAPRKRNSIETGIGFSDDVGARFKLNWLKPWLNDRGHSLDSKLALSSAEQSVEAAYKMPLETVATDFWQLQYGLRNRDYQDTRSKESNLALERHWLLESDWYRTASIRWLYEDYTQADQEDISSLIMPGLSFSRARQTGSGMPIRADRLLLGIEVSDRSWGSDESFIRLRGRAGYINTFSDNHRLVSRIDAGAVLMAEIDNLPPSIRFFAGGDNNLRGYAYESVSPLNSEDELIGGRYMATASLEYQYRVKGNWWLATFADYGSAWSNTPDWKRGVGVGVRWGSPIGAVRIDFAWGLDAEGSPFQLHFSLGPEL
ncbi:autotransporter assembly complex protein TamA [Alishewanella tabrizica]|uniref:Translocation and assembly module subunit TamA n=1 Tax=Alishewanella tabrizica TaxID=671278 RepID=A0ABQ2WS37_9ALTE|nr:autotransporter assembly complex family protein [Alishewanella tabrizica]GGW70934.1 outer membrane protein assembly factor [Alishewanella tabrizica]